MDVYSLAFSLCYKRIIGSVTLVNLRLHRAVWPFGYMEEKLNGYGRILNGTLNIGMVVQSNVFF